MTSSPLIMPGTSGRPQVTTPTGQPRPRRFRRRAGLLEVTADIACLQDRIVNLYFVGSPHKYPPDWVLVDAGLAGSAQRIVAAAEQRFGVGARPQAIVLTHGHFDHVGAALPLAHHWDVPIYIHPLELPYVTGGSEYPPPDPTVGGGLMARLACLYPRGPADLRGYVYPLPDDGSVPFMPRWRWIATPGHSPGHVSLFRDDDRVLLAGDAFVTTKQESLLAVLLQYRRIHGPPSYYTPDWANAWASVQHLAELHPSLAATGHGLPLGGPPLERQLQSLAARFDRVAVPRHGRYVEHAAVADMTGVVALPPPVSDPLLRTAVIAGVALIGWRWLRRK